MVPHAGMNGELTSPGAAYASLHNMSPQMSAAAAAAAVVAYGRSPMVGHTLHAISVVWVAGHWRRLHASFSTVEFPSYNSARALAVSLCFTLLCGWRSKSVPWEQRILVYWCMFLFFSSVLCLSYKCQTVCLCFKWKISFSRYKSLHWCCEHLLFFCWTRFLICTDTPN